MKKILTICIFFIFTSLTFASELETLLQKAIESYNSGDTETALQNIDLARKIIDTEKLQNENNEYTEIASWDVVKLKKALYLGKKVKLYTMYSGVYGSEEIVLNGPGGCNFNEQLVDKILTLQTLKRYTFYGTVKEGLYGPTLFVEAIE